MKRIAFAVFAALSIAAAPAASEEAIRIGKISKADSEKLISIWKDASAVRRQVEQILPEFKLPAEATFRCSLGPDGIICVPAESTQMKCPESINLEVPGQKNTVEVPVDCIGPDKYGECECEVASQ